MSLCTLALWLAACALAARAQVVGPQCSHPNCKWVRTEGEYEYYLINGEENSLEIKKNNEQYAAKCSPLVPLDDPARPRFPSIQDFEYVALSGCAPPAGTSYAAALKALNVPVKNKLNLFQLPADAHISASSLADLPSLQDLTLDVTQNSSILELEPGALTAFDRLNVLRLNRVRADRLPKVSTLRLVNVEELPPGALEVEVLEIEDHKITSINASVPQMKRLQLYSMPSLTSLALHNVSLMLRLDKLTRQCPALEILELRYLSTPLLPDDLLVNAVSLKSFTCTNGIITVLPLDLFIHSPHLQVIDVSHNRLDWLPNGVFSKVPELQTLRMEGNHLNTRLLHVFAPLTALTALDLGGNPLEHICSHGKPSPLSSMHQLQRLSLARTGTPHVCAWLGELSALQHLDLSGNDVHNVSCADLQAQNPGSTVVDLQNNPLDQPFCLQDDSSAFGNSESRQISLLTSNGKCDCSCPFVKCITGPSKVSDVTVPFDTTTAGTWESETHPNEDWELVTMEAEATMPETTEETSNHYSGSDWS